MKSPDLKPLHERAHKLARSLAFFVIEHIPRELNSEADALANLALDRTGTVGSQAAPSAPVVKTPSVNAPNFRAPIVSGATTSPHSERAVEEHLKPTPKVRVEKTVERSGEKIIRARYSAGALHPLEVLDLYEGEVVEVRISKKHPA